MSINMQIHRLKESKLDITHIRRKREDESIKIRKEIRSKLINTKRHSLAQNKIKVDNSQNGVRTIEEILSELLLITHSSENKSKLYLTISLRELLLDQDRNKLRIVYNSGIMPILIDFLKHDHLQELQYESAWILTNIAEGPTDCAAAVVSSGAIPILFHLLESSNSKIIDQSIMTLGNIAGDENVSYSTYLLNNGILDFIENLCKKSVNLCTLEVSRTISWTLNNLTRKFTEEKFPFINHFVKLCCQFLKHFTDHTVLKDICQCVENMTGSTNPSRAIDCVLESDMTLFLLNIMKADVGSNYTIQKAGLRIISDIVGGLDGQTTKILQYETLNVLKLMLSYNRFDIRKEVCFVLSNIVVESVNNLQSLLDIGIIPLLQYILENDCVDVKNEALYVINNMLSTGNVIQVKSIISKKMIIALSEVLDASLESNAKITFVTLNCFKKILEIENKYNNTIIESCGAAEMIEGLQASENVTINELATSIVDNYFDKDDSEDCLEDDDDDDDDEEWHANEL